MPITSVSYPRHGYTLIELSVVIAIVSVLIAGALAGYQQFSTADKVKLTNSKMDHIEQALVEYFNTHRSLPCPAAGNVAITSNAFGQPASSGVTTCTTPDGGHGTIPTQALNLQPEDALDGWGNLMSYYLSPGMNLSGEIRNIVVQGAGEAEVYPTLADASANTNSLTGLAQTTPARNYGAAYVMVSHGQNGEFAYRRSGSGRAPGTAGTAEEENGDNDLRFVQQQYGVNFDDIVRFGSKIMLGEGVMLKNPLLKERVPSELVTYATNIAEANGSTTGLEGVNPAAFTGVQAGMSALLTAFERAVTWLQFLNGLDSDTASDSVFTQQTVWKCPDNLLYMTSTGTANTSGLTYTSAQYRYSPGVGRTRDCACPNYNTPNNRRQRFMLHVGAPTHYFASCR